MGLHAGSAEARCRGGHVRCLVDRAAGAEINLIMISLHLDINDLNSAQSLLISLPKKNADLEKRATKVEKYLEEREIFKSKSVFKSFMQLIHLFPVWLVHRILFVFLQSCSVVY